MRAELHFQQQLQRDLRESAADAALAAARAAMEPVDGCVHAGCVPGHAAAPVPDLDGCTPSTPGTPSTPSTSYSCFYCSRFIVTWRRLLFY